MPPASGPSKHPPARVVVVAASAGGVEAIGRVVDGLPAALDAAVCVVLHVPAAGRSLLAPILARRSALPVVVAEDGALLEPGTVYVTPADRHLLVHERSLALSAGPKENGVRPAADVTLRSLARSWGPAAVAVVLTGALDDGAAGAAAVAAAGGTVIVQDPADATVASMPASALAAVPGATVAPAAEIGALLTTLPQSAVPAVERAAPGPAGADADPLHEPPRPDGPASGYTCPECSGALWELRDGGVVRYRCRVGHAYSEDAMVAAQGESVEAALWAALEVLEERSELLERIAGRVERAPRSAGRFRSGAREAAERAALIRRALAIGSAGGMPSVRADDEESAA